MSDASDATQRLRSFIQRHTGDNAARRALMHDLATLETGNAHPCRQYREGLCDGGCFTCVERDEAGLPREGPYA